MFPRPGQSCLPVLHYHPRRSPRNWTVRAVTAAAPNFVDAALCKSKTLVSLKSRAFDGSPSEFDCVLRIGFQLR